MKSSHAIYLSVLGSLIGGFTTGWLLFVFRIELLKLILVEIKPNILTIANIIIPVVGWFIVARSGANLQKKILKSGEDMKVFDEIWNARKTVNNLNSQVNAALQSPPFTLMEFTKSLAQNIADPLNRLVAEQKAFDHWQEYMKRLSEHKVEYDDAVLDLWQMLEMRSYAFPQLEKAIKALFTEYRRVSDELNEYYSYLQRLGYDWEKWDRNDIIRRYTILLGENLEFGAYIGFDMMNLVHNHLVSSYFPYKKKTRAPGDPTLKVLTEDGLAPIKR